MARLPPREPPAASPPGPGLKPEAATGTRGPPRDLYPNHRQEAGMPEHMRMTRDELVNFLEESVKKGCAERIHAVLAARARTRGFPRRRARSPISRSS